MNQAKPGKKSNKPSYGGFEGYNLDSFLYRGIKAKGYNLPTPIQRRAIPIILQGFNVIAMARTGSGKTASFVIPIIQKLKAHSTTVGARSLILSPTRELAMQTATYFKSLAKNSDLTYVLIVGGNDMENQFERLLLNPDVIIATPGRLMHCMTQTNLQLSQVSMVVYDEADRLFEMGFAEQIKAITDRMPKSRQSLLFSATISTSVRDFSLSGMKDYKMVQVDKDSKLSDNLKLHFFVVRTQEKEAALFYILRERVKAGEQTIIFGATRYHCEYLYEMCTRSGMKSTLIYGAMDQRAREDQLFKFRKKYVSFLFVTDLAARGLDIPLLENVVHYDFPTKLKLFIHRSGRTARAGQKGTSYAIITQDELAYLNDLSIFVGRPHFDQTTPQNPDLVNDPGTIAYGCLTATLMDEYSTSVAQVKHTHKVIMDPLIQSIKNSLTKYHKTRDPASVNSIAHMRDLLEKKKINVHPLIADDVDEKEADLMCFKEQLAAFKPKASALEIGIIKSKNDDRIEEFKKTVAVRQMKLKEKEVFKASHDRYKAEQQHDEKLAEQVLMQVQAGINQHDQKLQAVKSAQPGVKVYPLNKRDKKRVRKIEEDKDLTRAAKDLQIAIIRGNSSQLTGIPPPVKRQKMTDYKDKDHYMQGERPSNLDEQTGKNFLWTDQEKNFLEDVTLNLIPDDEALNVKGKTVMKWDSIKKRYTLQRVDREGKVIREKRNESGGKIKKTGEGNEIYKTWQKKTHLSLQKDGEKEDQNQMQSARDANQGKRGMTQFRQRHAEELNKGEDVRDNKKLVDAKKKKFISKMRESGMKKGQRDGISDKFTGGKKITEKSRGKIVGRSAPTRSKAIVKGGRSGLGSREARGQTLPGRGGGKGQGGGRGGRGGSRGSSVPGRRKK